jgi:hypothetical protein
MLLLTLQSDQYKTMTIFFVFDQNSMYLIGTTYFDLIDMFQLYFIMITVLCQL